MALTNKQKFNISNEIIRPEAMPLMELITLAGYTHAQYFLDTAKETEAETLADSYLQKIEATARKVKAKDGTTLLAIKDSLIISTWGNIMDYVAMKNWDDTDWENNVSNFMSEVFERISDVTNAERTAYQGL